MSDDRPVVVYTADASVRDWKRVLRDMVVGALHGRFLAFRLFRRDMQADFAQSFFGYLWNFADPIILAIVFVFLRKGGVLGSEELPMPFAAYVVYGLLLLQAFLGALNQPLNLLKRSENLLGQVKVPIEALLGALGLRLLFDTAFYVPILLIVSLWTGAFHPLGFVLMVLLLPVMLMLGLSISLLLIPINALYNDFQMLVRNLNRPLIFLCPTFYYFGDRENVLAQVNAWNPIAIVMDNLRFLAIHGQLLSPGALATVAGGALLLLLIGWFLVHVTVPVLISRL